MHPHRSSIEEESLLPIPPTELAVIEGLIERLHLLKEELAVHLSETADASAPVDLEQPFGRLSRMDAMQQQQMARAARAGQSRRLEQVKSALARVERGEYGMCVSCEEDIEVARLVAKPEAPLCLVCQSALERSRRR